MRKVLLLSALACMMCFGFLTVNAQSGGPDAYGYTWKDSNDPNGPTFSWVDITTTGTKVQGLADDNAVGPFSMGISFPFYWDTYDEVKIGSNGWVSFKNVGNIASPFPTMPSPGGNADNFVAPLMSDLSFTSSYPGQPNIGEIYYYGDVANNRFIVSYINVPWWRDDQNGLNAPDWEGSNTFQVIFDASDSTVTFQYLTMTPGDFDNRPNYQDLVTGIENVTGNIGLMVHDEEAGSPPYNTLPGDNYAVTFYHPGTSTLQIPDATPAWNANSDNQGQFFLTNRDVDLLTNIEHVGNADITTPITVNGEVRNLQVAQVWSGSETVNSLPAGTDNLVTFSNQWSITTAGQYYYEVNIVNNDDINPSNNDNTVEISAVEQDGQGKITLSYASQNAPDGVIQWTGGSGGCGIKIVPPGYPVTIESVDFYVLFDTTQPAADMILNVYDDDAAPGTGTLLGTTTAAGSGIQNGTWHNMALASPITINDGAFYVSWEMGGSNIALGTEAFGPISRRSFEILAGAWATYRQNTAEEYLINVNIDGSAIGIEEDIAAGIPAFETFPNPTTGLANVRFELPAASDAHFTVLDLRGQQVFEKAYGMTSPGTHQFSFGTDSFAPGVYLVKMDSNGKSSTQKLIVR